MKRIALALATASLFLAVTALPAVAVALPITSQPAPDSAALVEPRVFLTLTKTLTSASGVRLKVTYTYNDGYGIISGIQSATVVAPFPTNISDLKISYKIKDNGRFVEFIINYYNSSTQSRGTDYVYLYA